MNSTTPIINANTVLISMTITSLVAEESRHL